MATMPIAMSCGFHFKGRLLPEETVLRNVPGKYHTQGCFASLQSFYGPRQVDHKVQEQKVLSYVHYSAVDISFGSCNNLLYPHGEHFRRLLWPISAARSGSESSVSGPKLKDITLTDVKINVESRDEDKIHVRVDLTAEQTEKVFDDVLTNLARTAPPIPGFRRQKGGKTSNVPKSFLLQVLGRDRVTKFVIQEILSSTMGNYVEQENLKVKKTFQTTQPTEELESAFVPGNEFGFNVTLEFEMPDSEVQPGESETEPSVSVTGE